LAHLSPRSLSFLDDEHRLIHIMVYLCLTLPWITSGDLDLLYMIPKNPGDPICGTLIRQRPLAILISAFGRRSWHIPERISRLLNAGLDYCPLHECGVLPSTSSRVLHINKLLLDSARVKCYVHQACVQGSCLRRPNLRGGD